MRTERNNQFSGYKALAKAIAFSKKRIGAIAIAKDKKAILFFALCLSFLTQTVSAQGPQKGMLRFQGTFGVGVAPADQDLRYYVWGDMEYLLTDQLGINGALYGQLGSDQNEFPDPSRTIPGASGTADLTNHFLFWGPVWHFRPGEKLDAYLGIQPGLVFSSADAHTVEFAPGEFSQAPALSQLGPAFSLNPGIAYYGSFFHLFVNCRLAAGQANDNYYRVKVLEIMPSFGLGFNFGGR